VQDNSLAWKVQANKCLAKEAHRKQVLANTMTSPSKTVDRVELASLDKAKQSAVNNIFKPANEKKKAAPVKTKTKRLKTKTKKRNALVALKDITNAPALKLRASSIQWCGCQHGDLDALKSFTKGEVTYYIRPTKFLEGRGCSDCQGAVTQMKPTAPSQKAVVFYCDEGIKGFDAPDDDPMKAALTCDLVLCPQCEAKRRIEFEKENAGCPGSGRKRHRQQTGVQ
jgi:hypothetical protein